MRKHLNGKSIAHRVHLKRNQHSGPLLIVEGVTDSRLYKHLLNLESSQITVAHGKDNAVNAIEALDKTNFAGVLAIVDADFWRLDGVEITSINLFITDSHDLEAMILQSPVLEKLLNEDGSAEKIIKFKKTRDIRQALLDIGKPIGYLRWVSQRDKYFLTFNNLNFTDFIDKDKLTIDVVKLVQKVKDKSNRHELDGKELQDKIRDTVDEKHNLWDICCGPDLVQILSIGFRKLLGAKKPTKADIERNLRIGYEHSYFLKTQLYRSLKNWEGNNQQFGVFV